MNQSTGFGALLGLGAGIICICVGMQGKAESIWISHPLNQGETVRVRAALVPFIGMERYPIEAECADRQDCDALEVRLQAAGYKPH